MSMQEQNLLERASQYWTGGEHLEAGKLIFENLPANVRPKWSAAILKLVLDKSNVPPILFEHVFRIANNPTEWRDGHVAFSRLRSNVLVLDEKRRTYGLTPDEELYGWILALAELVAKVTYNATDPLDEFDEDSGWWIATSLRGFVELWNDEEFSNAAWASLSGRDV